MAAKKGRQYQMSADHRRKIENSCILKALVEHVEGKREMSSTQVTAGLGLLKKIMPDVTYSETNNTHDISDPMKELVMYVAANGGRLVKSDDN